MALGWYNAPAVTCEEIQRLDTLNSEMMQAEDKQIAERAVED